MFEQLLQYLDFALPILIAFLGVDILINMISPEGKGKRVDLLSRYASNIKTRDNSERFKEIYHYANKLTSYLPNDSFEQLRREMIRNLAFGIVVVLSSVLMKQIMLGAGVALFFVSVPILNRVLAKSDNKKIFKDQFFDAIFFLILFVSGGMSLQQAVEETAGLFPKNTPFRIALDDVIKNYNLTNDNFVRLFERFEKDYEIEEVSFFVNSMRISYNNGVGVRDSLLNQLDYIRTNRNFAFKSIASSFGNKLTPIMIAFTMLPILIIMGLPPILEAIENLG